MSRSGLQPPRERNSCRASVGGGLDDDVRRTESAQRSSVGHGVGLARNRAGVADQSAFIWPMLLTASAEPIHLTPQSRPELGHARIE
jgi:hypothetical protein